MSDENIWGEEEAFNDMPDEAQLDENGRPKKAPPVVITGPKNPPPAPVAVQQAPVEEYVEQEEVQESEEDVEDVLSDAQLRLEQGSLYKMIMNHNLFEGVDSDPRAIQIVQREIRQVAQEKMEVMLGMRQEKTVSEHPNFKFPFNSLEVEVLKQLAFTATKGASENAEDYVPGEAQETAPPKRQTLKPIGSAPAPRRAAPPPAPQPKKPLAKKPAAPVQRTKLQKTIEQIAREEGVPLELLEIDAAGVGGKPLNEYTPEELAARNRIAAQRRGEQVKSSDALPMATPEQQAAMAIQRASQMSSASPLMTKIIEAAKVMPASKILNPGQD